MTTWYACHDPFSTMLMGFSLNIEHFEMELMLSFQRPSYKLIAKRRKTIRLITQIYKLHANL